MVSHVTHQFWIRYLNKRPSNLVALRRAALLLGKKVDELQSCDKLEYLYRVLGILDDKAQSLMQFNAFVIGLVAIFWSKISDTTSTWAYWPGVASVIGSLASIFACLLVVGIFWRFLAVAVPWTAAEPAKAAAHDDALLVTELEALCKVVHMRETAYQFAWLASLVSLLALVPIVLIAFIR